jgi:hypothetical protein
MSLFLKTRFFLVHVASVEGFVLFSELWDIFQCLRLPVDIVRYS